MNAEPEDSGEALVAQAIAKNLRRTMEEQGINQAELCRRAGMPTTTVNRVFTGLERGFSPRLGTLVGIARGLGVDLSLLLEDEPSRPAPKQSPSPFIVARQISRLVEDFLLSSEAARLELLAAASRSATEGILGSEGAK